MKWILTLLLSIYASLGVAQEMPNAYNLKVNVDRTGGRFHISVSYQVPISLCNAYSFLTDYEGAKKIPGIVQSRVLERAGNKVIVERSVEERILLIPIEMHSVLEYTETVNQGVTFEQMSGDAKSYKGSWQIVANGNLTTFKYESTFEPQSSLPNFLIEYFIKNSIRERFDVMAEKVAQRNTTSALACK